MRKTEKLYYLDQNLQDFEAEVLDVREIGKGWSVLLDRTAFYPEGGGQPADIGSLSGIPVLDVQKKDDLIYHILEKKPETKLVQGKIDWNHRFDYMQQHTGQHIISACLYKTGGIGTVAIHQGEEYTSVETDASGISPETLEQIEKLANSIVNQNLDVTSIRIDHTELSGYTLRRPTKLTGKIRLLKVGEIDLVACGGVHTTTTGQVGLIKLAGTEKIRGRVRTIWKIGNRAYRDYHLKNQVVSSLVEALSAQPDEVPSRVLQLQEDLRQGQWELNRLEDRYAGLVAESLYGQAAPSKSGLRIITKSFEGEDKELPFKVAQQLLEKKGVRVCLTTEGGEYLHWCIGISDSCEFPAGEIREKLLPLIEGKGGGKPPLWQGVGQKEGDVEGFLKVFRKIFS